MSSLFYTNEITLISEGVFVTTFVRPGVIETPTYRWQRYVLPLNYGRIRYFFFLGTVFNTISGSWSIHVSSFFFK